MPISFPAIPRRVRRRGAVRILSGGGPYTIDAAAAEVFQIEVVNFSETISVENMLNGDRLLLMLRNTNIDGGGGGGGSSILVDLANFRFSTPTAIEILHGTTAFLDAVYYEASQFWAVLSYQSNFSNEVEI